MASKQVHQKLSHEEHVLQLSDTYIGDTEKNTCDFWCYNPEKKLMENKPLTYIPGEYKLYDEILVNAFDQYIRTSESKDIKLSPVKNIKINVDQKSGLISVYNDGEGIPIEIHPKEKIYIPELIFGELLTSSNYDKDEIKHVGGKNGYGAKLANIFSVKFTITTVDKNKNKKFSMSFYDNKKRKDKPTITKYTSKPFTQIDYIPDFKRFNIEGISDDMMELMKKRAFDMAACSGNDLNIFFNDEKIDCRTFEKYINLYLEKAPRAYEKVNERWEIGCALSPSLSFEQVSFVNGINTSKGGKHVDYIINQITKKLCEFIEKKKKVQVKPNYIKENLMVFVKSTIDNPNFSSQTKESLTTNKDKFGSKCEINSKFIDALSKCGIVEKAISLAEAKQNKTLKKTDGKKQTRLTGIPKLEDANWAGTKKSHLCTLILTEGDSAKSTAMAGIEIIGRDNYGVFPLKGKPINVKDEKNIKKLSENTEIANIKKIMGLETNKKYKDLSTLRYGKILILTDQDEDGSHIKGLIFTLFEHLWPTLFKMDGFLNSMLTPIVKASHKKDTHEFYSLKDYEKFVEDNPNALNKFHVKYYKGLATSTPKEAKEYFRQLKLIKYTTQEKKDIDSLNLAFGKEKDSANNRKDWLKDYDRNNTLDYSDPKVSIENFINCDLIHFSNSDNIRSIPSMIDGLKPGQRKVLFGCFKRNLTNEIKVAQLAGYVSENSAYHHGEASLCGTIVNMAQDFIASNNINLLEPVGQFGTRVQGGKDAGQPRYIFTRLAKPTSKLFNKQDAPLLKDNYDDNMKVEPEYYVPILPMVLINGASGIGTGWSTEVPCFNPIDIQKNITRSINGEEMVPMIPWYKGFTGDIIKLSDNSYLSKGKYTINGNKLIVTELPVGMWTQKFKEILEELLVKQQNNKSILLMRMYNSYCTDVKIHFEISCDEEMLFDMQFFDEKLGMTKLEHHFKLCSKISTSNMVLYTKDFKLKKYKDELEILRDFIEIRKEVYSDRIEYIKKEIKKDLNVLEYKMKFIQEFIDEKIQIIRVKKDKIIEQLKSRGYPEIDGSYDYLIKMHIYNLSEDKIEELQQNIDNKNKEYNDISGETNVSIWNKELNDLDLETLTKCTTDSKTVTKPKTKIKIKIKTNKKKN